MKKILVIFSIFIAINTIYSATKIGKFLSSIIADGNSSNSYKVIIYLQDKGPNQYLMLQNPRGLVSDRSLNRRAKVLPNTQLVSYEDLPVYEEYYNSLKPIVKRIRHSLKWINAVSAEVYLSQIDKLVELPFVREIELLDCYKNSYGDEKQNTTLAKNEQPNGIYSLNYGSSFTQNNQINVPAVHNLGNYGQGIFICVMDAGFNRLSHEAFQQMQIIATYDFVNNRPYVGDGQGGQGSGSHGTQTLSTIGGYKDGKLIGPAFGSKFILAKTENTESETPIEMDNWARALEWADSIGVDVTSTSLGYLDFDPPYPSYTWQHMDGNTVPITIYADLAVKRGIVVVNSAGNDGYNATRNTLNAPADGDSVIAVGAVGSSGTRSSFSSVGNTVDGRIKPDVMAMGSGVYVASPYADAQYSSASGTSFSCPLAAGVAALILSENPKLTPMQVRDAMRNTANNSSAPNREYGWGILNALAAVNYNNIAFVHNPISDTSNTIGPYKIAVKITSSLGIDENSVKLFWGRGVITDSILMTKISADSFVAFIPGNGTSSTYKYYIFAKTFTGDVVKTHPKFAPIDLFVFNVSGNIVSFTTQSGWNLISVPLLVSNYSKDVLFPNSTSNAFAYENGYVAKSILENGKGYWLKFNQNQSHSFAGQTLTSFSVPVTTGWNLIGSISNPIGVNTLTTNPPNIISSLLYGYDESYTSIDSIYPGKGYWVKVSQNGSINLNSLISKYEANSYTNLKNILKDEVGKLIVTDAQQRIVNLYLIKNNTFNLQKYELPPPPPAGILDIRFTSNRLVEELNLSQVIKIQDAHYPIKIKSIGLNLRVRDEIDGKSFDEILSDGDEIILTDNKVNLLRISSINSSFSYRLEQNYPNPFNSKSKIKFEIPNREKVTLKVFDILGREILRLIDDELSPGNYEVEMDAQSKSNIPLSSGIYFYQVQTNSFTQTKKMIIQK